MKENIYKDFDDIRPYYDSEINAAMERISCSEFFPALVSFVYPDLDVETVRHNICQINSIDGFQLEVMRCFNEQVIKRTVSSFTFSGLENLEKERGYLFISNHRDIVLDSSLLQYALYLSGFQTTQITFGANLMSSGLVIDIGKSNKMFRVERPGNNPIQFYRASRHLSDYLKCVASQNESVWIAQRNGRTKDGRDKTDPAMLKMLGLSGGKDYVSALKRLNIMPMAISYEWEPCDILKAVELQASENAPYTKRKGEDMHSILTGITQKKCNVHISISQPISYEELEGLASLPANEFYQGVAELLDSRIITSYRLFPTNYIAHDIMTGTNIYRDHYSDLQRQEFISHIDGTTAQYSTNKTRGRIRDIILGIYANPVIALRQRSFS